MRITTLICAAALALLCTGDALAFDAAAPDGSTGASAPAVKQMTPPEDPGARSAKSIECSQKADAQDLHGKTRKRFMHDCKRGA